MLLSSVCVSVRRALSIRNVEYTANRANRNERNGKITAEKTAKLKRHRRDKRMVWIAGVQSAESGQRNESKKNEMASNQIVLVGNEAYVGRTKNKFISFCWLHLKVRWNSSHRHDSPFLSIGHWNLFFMKRYFIGNDWEWLRDLCLKSEWRISLMCRKKNEMIPKVVLLEMSHLTSYFFGVERR